MGVRLFSPRPVALVSPAAGGMGRGREAASLLLLTLAVYFALALASMEFDPGNPAVNGGDWVGPVGAGLARVLVQGFGVIAWLVPLELVLHAIPLLRRRAVEFSAYKLSGDLVVAVVLAALVQVALPDVLIFGAMRAGGNVGLLFGEIFRALFSTVGSFLIGVTAVGLILIGRSSFSFIEICDKLLALLQRCALGCQRAWNRVVAAWQEARALRAERLALARAERSEEPEEPSTDEQIMARLTEEPHLEWVPLEQTGAPPVVVSEALRRKVDRVSALSEVFEPQAVGADEADITTQVEPPEGLLEVDPDSEIEPASSPLPSRLTNASQDGGKGPERQKVLDGPKIVDTAHLAKVRRGRTGNSKKATAFALPSTDLLQPSPPAVAGTDKDRMLQLAQRLEATLANYGVIGKVEEIHPGPTVTTFELTPQAGTKVSKVAGLCDDLALGLSRKVRIIAPIPGKARIGFEVPNDTRVPVSLRELIEDSRFEQLADKGQLPVVMGRDIVGVPYYADLASMPHVIVAGATGAGKSVGLNVMLSSLLFKRSPDELRLLMIDPKVVELAPFDGIPHMLLPVVTDMKKATVALKWAVDEMERRYNSFASAGTKNITTYNAWALRVQNGELPAPRRETVEALAADGTPVCVPASKTGSDGEELPGKMPHIVIVVDEFADLMMQQGKEVEACVARLAQKARAAGMHVVLATQRPSVDVITGMIKANFPTRVAFRVTQKVDSRTILDEMGAELLLGRGDMLIKMNGATDTARVQCPFISEEEVNELTAYLRRQGAPEYHEDILVEEPAEGEADSEEALDPRFDEAVRIVADTQRCSTSWLQRKMTIGYNRAAKIVESMENRGIVGPPNGSKDREILVSPQ